MLCVCAVFGKNRLPVITGLVLPFHFQPLLSVCVFCWQQGPSHLEPSALCSPFHSSLWLYTPLLASLLLRCMLNGSFYLLFLHSTGVCIYTMYVVNCTCASGTRVYYTHVQCTCTCIHAHVHVYACMYVYCVYFMSAIELVSGQLL